MTTIPVFEKLKTITSAPSDTNVSIGRVNDKIKRVSFGIYRIDAVVMVTDHEIDTLHLGFLPIWENNQKTKIERKFLISLFFVTAVYFGECY